MDLTESLQILLRRWFAVLPTLAVTFLAGVYVVNSVPPTYEAGTSMLLIVPTKDPKVLGKNPYLNYGTLNVIGKVVLQIMQDDPVVDEIAAGGGTENFSVAQDPDRANPIFVIAAEADTARRAILTTELVATKFRSVLAARQKEAGAPEETWIRADDVTVARAATPLFGSRIRALAAVAVLGACGSVSVAFLADAIASRRARVRSARQRAGSRGATSPELALRNEPRGGREWNDPPILRPSGGRG